MSQSASTPNPIVSNIPPAHCYNPLNLRTEVNGNLVTFIWDSPHDNDGFYLNYWLDGDAPIQVTVFGSAIQISLLPGTLYNWSVRTMCDRNANRGSDTVIGVPVTSGAEGIVCPTVNIAGALVLVSGISARLEWSDVTSIQNYVLELRHSGSSVPYPVSNHYINLTQLRPNTEYSWRVRAVCDGKLSNFSDWAYFKTGGGSCPAVVIKGVTEITTGVYFWTNSEQAISYQVYFNGTILDLKHPVNIITLTNLSPNQPFTLIVIPNCPDGPGEMSIFTDTTKDYPVNNPTNLSSSFVNNNVTINWTPAENIDSQIIYINGSPFTIAADVSSFMIASPASNSKIAILIKSVHEVKGSSTGAYLEAVVPQYSQPVTDLNYTFRNHESVTLLWKATSGSPSYRIRYRTASGSSWISVTTDKTQYTVTGLLTNVDYVFEVIPVYNGIEGQGSMVNIATTPMAQCPIANNVAVSQVLNTSAVVSFGLSNEKVPYGGNYVVTADDGTNPPIEAAGTQSPILIEGLTADTDYNIVVYNRCGPDNNNNAPTSTSSVVAIKTLKTCTPPAALTAVLQTNNTELYSTWSASAGAVDYNFKYRRIGSPDWIDLGNNAALNKTVTPAVPSSIYEVMVTTNYGDYRSCSSSKTITIPKVLNVQKVRFGNTYTFFWDEIVGAQAYVVNVVSLDGTSNLKYITTFAKLRLEADTNYTVTVQAFYEDTYGAASDNMVFNTGSDVLEEEIPQCEPPIVELFKQDSNINDPDVTVDTKDDVSVRIKDYNNSLRYKIELIITGEVVPVAIINVAQEDPAFNGSALFPQVPTNDFSVRVSTYDLQGEICNVFQPVKDTADCTVPTGLASDNVTHESFDMTWDEVPDALGYEVYLDGDLLETVVTPAYSFTGLDPDTDYDVTVASKCGDLVVSAQSAATTVHTDTAP